MRLRIVLALSGLLLCASAPGCGDDGTPGAGDAGRDGGAPADAGGPGDAGSAGDGGPGADAGPGDAGPDPAGPVRVYVSLGGDDRIGIYDLDDATGVLTAAGGVALTGSPGSLAVDPSGRRLYAAVRSERSVAAFDVDPDTGDLRALGVTPVGDNPVYLSVDRTGGWLLSAYYGADRVAVHPIAPGGAVGSASSAMRATDTHPHSIVLSPDQGFAFVPNTGADRILQYAFDAADGSLSPNAVPEVMTGPVSGPRHMVFHPSGRFAWAVNEHSDSVTGFRYDDAAGRLAEIETLSTLPAGFDGAANTCADVHVTPSGRFLYASNRGHDSIAIFAIDAETGRLTSRGQESTEARPRELEIEPGGRYLYAAGQDSGRLAAYRIEPDGTLTPFDTYDVGAGPEWVLAFAAPR